MSHEITLQQAADKAVLAETIALLLEEYPGELPPTQAGMTINLIRRLCGEAACWLLEEQMLREAKQ
ncbi:hypothetical protein [Serratia sp. M24T3]|uniref:hypothetical protein n=1 Tax=Serratia sp. M24T3 TaxID=932213 RepID=UPI00025BAE87|nr:hypothetical protein [Serratia sp. M24T3]EIC82981.1 hypothetical protein SPM24T3_19398 [Serratia sp. M24T3]